MASRTATPPRVTGGRPATMTRSAVQQARTQTRPTTPTADSTGVEPPATADGWVNVDHNKRKHRQGPLLPTGVGAPTGAASTGRAANGREMRRTQSAMDATSASMAIPDKDEPPVARPNARADALSAAVTMDKKARERSYYTNANAPNVGGASSPLASLSLTTAPTWGSPPPPPGFAGQRGMHRAKSTSPDAAAAALQLERGSSLQKLMSAWQVSNDATEPPVAPLGAGGGGVGGDGYGNGNGSSARGGVGARTGGSGELMPGQMQSLGGMFDFAFGEYAPPPDVAGANVLRRTQSDVLPATMSLNGGSNNHINGANRQRSPTERTQGEGRRSNGNSTGNGNGNTNGNSNGAGNANQPNGTRKCGDKRDFFFRNLDFDTRSLLQIDEVASFSVTDFEMAKKISGAIVDLFPDLKAYAEQQAAADAFFYGLSGQDPALQPQRKFPLIITDATACVGGNVLSFCDYFHFVYAIENDATRVAMLENNLRVLNKTNVACRCASYLDVMYEYHQDVVFFDPPWGGPEYKDQDKVDLYLDEQPLYEICEQLQGYAKCIVLKVPTNFDDEKFAYCVSGRVTVRKDFKKMHLVVLDFR